jgi:hemerythrin-like domain-containing protein
MERVVDIVDAPLGEHGVLYDQGDRLVRAVSVAEDVVVVHARMFGVAVQAHSSLEDELLFVPLEQVLGADALSLVYMRMVHEQIDEGLADIRAIHMLEPARTRLLEVLAMTREHFREEEHALFPIARESLGQEVRERLGARWTARRGVSWPPA